MAEDDAAERAGGEAHRVGTEGRQRTDGRLCLGEEEIPEDQRGGRSVQEEVVPLDGGADEAGKGDLLDVAHVSGVLAARNCCGIHLASLGARFGSGAFTPSAAPLGVWPSRDVGVLTAGTERSVGVRTDLGSCDRDHT
jgi:hypothetical protein